MKVLFLGGDKRQMEIIKHLYKKEHDIDVVGYKHIQFDNKINNKNLSDINISNYDVIIFPVDGVKNDFNITCSYNPDLICLSEDFLKGAKNKSLIFTGVMTNNLNKMLGSADKDAIVLMDKQKVKEENSIPTVEGIIANIVNNTDHTINGSKILVLGYGNVGSLLVDKLKGLGAKITVGVSLFDEYKKIKINGVNCVYANNRTHMKMVIKRSDVIINTIPAIVMDEEYLQSVKKEAYILDVASSPHGINFKEANRLQIKNELLPGIPGKTAPKTAGLILFKEINSILERRKI